MAARSRPAATGLGLIPDPDAVRAVWTDAVAAPGWAGPALWLHADLHPLISSPQTAPSAG